MNGPPLPSANPDARTAEDRPPRRAGALEALRAVVWSFCGIRGRAAYEQDVQRLSPLQVVVAGIVAALTFVAALVLLVRWVVGSGVAG